MTSLDMHFIFSLGLALALTGTLWLYAVEPHLPAASMASFEFHACPPSSIPQHVVAEYAMAKA